MGTYMDDKKIIRYILRVLGILCLVYGAALLYFVTFSSMVLVWYIMGAVLTVLSLKKVFRAVFSIAWISVVALTCVVIVVILEGLVIVNGNILGPPASCDYLLVLGGTVMGETQTETVVYRLDKTYEYMAAHQETYAILSGGQCEGEAISEAEAMYRYLAAKGIDKARLIKEDQSGDTYENIRNCFKLIGDNKNLKLCVVTSDFHVFRAKMLAAKMGRQVDGLGAETYLPLIPFFQLREMLAIVKDLVIH